MTYFDGRLQEVAGHFSVGDTHLGYRRLLDAALETRNFQVYEATLGFCDWFDTASSQASTAAMTEKVNELLRTMAQGYTASPPSTPAIRLAAEGVAKSYAHGRFQLHPTRLQLKPGEIIGLVGENGNGKTTLLRLLNGELKPDSGTILYEIEQQQRPPTLYQTKSAIGFIPQRPQQWYGGLMDNLQYASSFSGYKGRQNRLWTEMIVARMGLRPFRSYNWSRISSGYKMRFELARTLIRKPAVLLLDEPLANLDLLAQQIVLEDLRYLAQSHTMPLSIVLSSQQLYEVEKVSDQVLFLQNGKPYYQDPAVPQEQAATGLTVELETPASRQVLNDLFAADHLQKISYNGGVYIIYFDGTIRFSRVLSLLGESDIRIKYIRDISTSSRRFFDA